MGLECLKTQLFHRGPHEHKYTRTCPQNPSPTIYVTPIVLARNFKFELLNPTQTSPQEQAASSFSNPAARIQLSLPHETKEGGPVSSIGPLYGLLFSSISWIYKGRLERSRTEKL